MASNAEILESKALQLPRTDRSRLVVHLLQSMDERPAADPKRVEALWLQEADRRYQAYLHGEELTIPAEAMFSELRAEDR